MVINTPREKKIKLTNNSATNLEISGITLSGSDQFSIPANSAMSLAPNESRELTVRFNPLSSGEYNATVTISYNSDQTKSISLQGIGVDNPTKRLLINPDDLYSFGDLNVTKEKTRTFTIQNLGSDPATISSISLNGFTSEAFSISSPTVFPFELGSGEIRQMSVHFKPTSLGIKEADLIITNNSDNFSPTHSIQLYGNGTESIYTGGGSYLTGYEYWFDDQYSTKIYTNIIAPYRVFEFNDSIAFSGLTPGLHTLHFRYKDKKGRWSSVVSEFFHKLPETPENNRRISKYEYWFDEGYNSKQSLEASHKDTLSLKSSLVTTSLNNGLHALHMRFRDDAGQWSPVFSEDFHKLPVLNEVKKISSYEYWIDEGYHSKVFTPISPQDTFKLSGILKADSLKNGLHSWHMRFRDNAGQWSAVISDVFHKLPVINEPRKITSYEYWFDEGFGTKKSLQLSPEEVLNLKDTVESGSLVSGLHSLYFRFRDNAGQWSTLFSESFQKLPVSKKITAYEYWFDNDYLTKKSLSFSPAQIYNLDQNLEGASLQSGLHSWHMRFKDEDGHWSSVVSEVFHKTNHFPNNRITNYRYWFNSAPTEMTSISIASSTNPYELSRDINLSALPEGNQLIHFQFRDSNNIWSSVLTDTVYRSPILKPVIIADGPLTFCQGGSVKLTSSYANSYLWSNGATTQSILVDGSGDYQVTVQDANVNKQSSEPVSIIVNTLPDIPGEIDGDKIVCKESTLNYSIPQIQGAESYSWTLPEGFSGDSNANSIAVKILNEAVSGLIKVRAHNSCGDGPESTLAIAVNNLPGPADFISGKTNLCKGSSEIYSIPLISGAESYAWVLPTGLTGSSTSNTISVTVGPESSGGAIKVKGVNSCGEGKESSLALVINNLPSPAGMISGKANVLKGAAEIYTVPEIPGAQSYIWTLPNGMTGTGNINSISILVGEEAVSGNIKVRGHNDCGDGAENALALSVNEIPATAGLISGKSMVCKGTVVSYSVPVIPGAESYIWSLPTGFKGSSSSLTITVSIESNAVNGEIKVKGSNSSGEGQESSLQVSIKELPSQLDLISGNPTVCKGTSEIYSVPVNQNSDTYIWTLPPGTSGSSAVNSVSAFFGPDAVSGIVSVKGQNICGEGPIRSLPVNINSGPAAATEIIGKMEICKGGSEIYSVQPILGADSYVWTLPSGMTGSSSSNSIAISTSAAAGSGNLIVKGINACGAGLEKSLFISVKELPVSLGPITGKDMVCKGTSEIYSVPALTNADTYSWSLPGGFSGNSLSNHLTALVGTNAIQGIIKVKAQNSCGEGPESTLGVKVNQSPSEAGTITGNSIICLEESELYSVPEITGADAYSWTLPSGLYGSSDSNSIMITAGNSVVSGNIQVSGKNTCGEGLAASRAVNVITGVVPQIASKWNDILICYNLENKIQSYQWYKGDSKIPNATDQFYATHKQSGNYKVQTMDVNGCKNFSNIIPLTGQPSILAYPNPTSTIFNLKFEDETTGRAIISVFNSKGYKVMEFQTEKQSNELMLKDIPVNNLTSGVYIIQIMMNQTDFFTTRLVVLKN